MGDKPSVQSREDVDGSPIAACSGTGEERRTKAFSGHGLIDAALIPSQHRVRIRLVIVLKLGELVTNKGSCKASFVPITAVGRGENAGSIGHISGLRKRWQARPDRLARIILVLLPFQNLLHTTLVDPVFGLR